MSTLHTKSCLHIFSLCLDYESVFYHLSNLSYRSRMHVNFSFELLLWVSIRLHCKYVQSKGSGRKCKNLPSAWKYSPLNVEFLEIIHCIHFKKQMLLLQVFEGFFQSIQTKVQKTVKKFSMKSMNIVQFFKCLFSAFKDAVKGHF